VDVLLAVDMLTHTFRGNCDHVSLLTGDLDFKPVVDAVVQLGAKVEIWYERTTASEELLAAADSRQEMTLRTFHGWAVQRFRRANTIPEVSTGTWTSQEAIVLRRGLLRRSGHEVRVYATHRYVLVVDQFDGRSDLFFAHHDPDQLLAFCDADLGGIAWE
jgi:hypothetical protein